MAKISPISAKYIVHATINIDGVVDRPDVIGAIFGQTEGLLGADLELRELQRSGRIGRIEVNVDTSSGKTSGTIVIPSSLDKAETSIVAAALEVIQRIGPCNARIKVDRIEDVRISKRKFVIERAKELLKNLMDSVMPDSQELADEVTYSVRVMEVQEYGNERLPAGPAIDESDEVIVVEGRADVLNLLKHGFKNAIALNGTSVPKTIIELSKKKVITAFVDGDRGGNLILKELLQVADIDYITRAPDGKEVEEITKKEIHKALRSRIAAEQVKFEIPNSLRDNNTGSSQHNSQRNSRYQSSNQRQQRGQQSKGGSQQSQQQRYSRQKKEMSPQEKSTFKQMLEDLIGTRGAYILDSNLNILGKVPITELVTTLKSLSSGVYAVVFDGSIDKTLVQTAEKIDVSFLVGMDSKVKPNETSIGLITASDL
ncbi:DNA primase [Candidatus Woesearchaeota archaeon]|nr:MAG: DNA primase [Candidatus Woesearchaeota archaeon]